jgi:hypothetical protein
VRTGVVSGQFEETGEDVPDWKATDVWVWLKSGLKSLPQPGGLVLYRWLPGSPVWESLEVEEVRESSGPTQHLACVGTNFLHPSRALGVALTLPGSLWGGCFAGSDVILLYSSSGREGGLPRMAEQVGKMVLQESSPLSTSLLLPFFSNCHFSPICIHHVI